jgi:hypothetical protein
MANPKSPKSNAKMTGDLHLPAVESELPVQEGSSGLLGEDGTPSGRTVEKGGPPRGVSKAGLLLDRDEAPSGGDEPSAKNGAAPRRRAGAG